MSLSRCLAVVSFLRKPCDWECKSQDPGSHQVEDYRKHPIESAILFHKFTLLSPSTSKSGLCWRSIQLKNRKLIQDTPRFIHISSYFIINMISFDNYDASWCIPYCLRYFSWNFMEFSYHPGLDPPRINGSTHARSFAPYRAAVPVRSDRSSLPGMMSNIYRKPWCLPAVWILKHMKPDETGHFWKVT